MDRFIDTKHHNLSIFDTVLKSNMDRFIGYRNKNE